MQVAKQALDEPRQIVRIVIGSPELENGRAKDMTAVVDRALSLGNDYVLGADSRRELRNERMVVLSGGGMAGGPQRFVAHEQVSTKRQGASGLGLEAQRKAIDEFAASKRSDVIARFTEVESGTVADRPELAKALHLAKVTGAGPLIAKLDRLSRNAAFLLTLRDSGVRFVAADGTRRTCGRLSRASAQAGQPAWERLRPS